MIKYLRIHLFIIFIISSAVSYAQRDKYRLYIKANVPGKSSVSYKITYLGESVYSDHFEKAYTSDPGSRNVDVRFTNVGTSRDVAKTFSSSFCVKEKQSSWLGFPISATGEIDFQLIPPALKTPVGEITNTFYEGNTLKIKTQGVNDGDYVWEISRDATSWKEIETTINPVLELTGSKLSSFFYGTINRPDTYGKFYVRVKPRDGCIDDRISDPNVFYYNPPAPTGKPEETLCENYFLVLKPDPLCAIWAYCEYVWQVSEDGGASWKNLITTSSSNYGFSLDMITVSTPKFYRKRMIRYKKKGWGDELASAPVVDIVHYPSAPSVNYTNLEITPASCEHKADGKLILKNNIVGGTPEVTVSLKYKSAFVVFKDQIFPWDRLSDYVFENVPGGDFELQLLNIGSESCPTTFYLTIPFKPALQFTEVKKEDVTCTGRSDGSIIVNVKDGLTPRVYTLYKNDGKGNWIEQNKISKPESTHIFSLLTAGNYKVAASDGCNVVTQDISIENPVLTLSVVSMEPAYCGLAYGKIEVQMSGGKSPYTYSWKAGAKDLPFTTSTAANLFPGIYTVIGTDANGCSSKPLNVEVTEGIHPSLEVKTNKTGCGLAKGEITAKINQGFAPYTFTWKDKNGMVLRTFTQSQSEDTLKNLLKGNYTLQVEDSKKCQVQTNVVINEYDPISIQLSKSTLASCPESTDGKVSIEATGGLAPYIYEWNDEKKQTGVEASNLKVGTYIVKVTDALGCSNQKEIEVKSIPALLFTETIQPPTCYETCDASIAVNVTGGTAPYTYLWSNGLNTNQIKFLCEGKYTLTVTDAKNCVKTISYEVKKPSELFGVLKEKEATICRGQVMTLDAGEYTNYNWKDETKTIIGTNRTITLTKAGKYFLQVVNKNGCVIQDQFTLHTSTSLLEAKIVFATPRIVGDTVVLTELSLPKPETWTWTYAPELLFYKTGPSDGQEQVILSKAGTYQIQFIAGLGECRDTVSRTITVLPPSEQASLLNQLTVLGSKSIKQMSLYPNSNSGKFTLEIKLEQSAPIQVQIYGWQSTDPIYQTTFEENTVHKKEIELFNLPSGIYVVVVYVPNQKPAIIKLMIE